MLQCDLDLICYRNIHLFLQHLLNCPKKEKLIAFGETIYCLSYKRVYIVKLFVIEIIISSKFKYTFSVIHTRPPRRRVIPPAHSLYHTRNVTLSIALINQILSSRNWFILFRSTSKKSF